MKKMNIAGKLLAVMLLGGILGACQNEDLMRPDASANSTSGDRNAKAAAAAPVKLLIEDGATKLSYIKSGRYAGRLDKVVEAGGAFTTQYSYSDGYNGESFILAETKNTATGAYTSQLNYKLVNGYCTKISDIRNNKTYILTYGLSASESPRLDKIELQGSSEKKEFTYLFSPSTGAERLSKIVSSNANGSYQEIGFQYGGNTLGISEPKKDKYFLNHEQIGLDKYLPIFGKFSDLLVSAVTIKPLPYNGQTKPYYIYVNWLNSDGLVESRWRTYYPLGEGNNSNIKTDIFNQKYGYPTGI